MTMQSKLWNAWGVKDAWGIEIIDGPFTDVVVQIESLDFVEDDDGAVNVEYHSINIPERLDPERLKSQEFIDTLQVIIAELLTHAVETAMLSEDNDNGAK